VDEEGLREFCRGKIAQLQDPALDPLRRLLPDDHHRQDPEVQDARTRDRRARTRRSRNSLVRRPRRQLFSSEAASSSQPTSRRGRQQDHVRKARLLEVAVALTAHRHELRRCCIVGTEDRTAHQQTDAGRAGRVDRVAMPVHGLAVGAREQKHPLDAALAARSESGAARSPNAASTPSGSGPLDSRRRTSARTCAPERAATRSAPSRPCRGRQ
jgi:hypothetical protein